MTHEYSIVESLVEQVLKKLEGAGNAKVTKLRFRRGSAFSEEALFQAFEAHSAGTLLEGVTLEVETVNLAHKCSCGNEQIINSDDLVGHMFICPVCGTIREVDEAHDLELLEIVTA